MQEMLLQAAQATAVHTLVKPVARANVVAIAVMAANQPVQELVQVVPNANHLEKPLHKGRQRFLFPTGMYS